MLFRSKSMRLASPSWKTSSRGRHRLSKLSGDIIKFGATVTLVDKDTGNEKVWQIVGEPEADANKGRISVISPIARALIGKAKGATVEVEAPGGAKVYKVRQVEWLEHRPKSRKPL